MAIEDEVLSLATNLQRAAGAQDAADVVTNSDPARSGSEAQHQGCESAVVPHGALRGRLPHSQHQGHQTPTEKH